MKPKNQKFRDMQDNFKRSNIQVIEVSEGKERELAENIFEEITAGNFLNFLKDINLQFQEVQQIQI